VTGSCRDIALAGAAEPDLFREKCRGIYLNAGTGTFDPEKGANTEWNVTLDVQAYTKVFALPCPVFWLPCFDEMGEWPRPVQPYGSFWRFKQEAVLADLSPGAQNFFMYTLTRNADQKWLAYLQGDVDQAALSHHGSELRNMWCTAGFLHMAGLTVSDDGAIAERTGGTSEGAVFGFEPIAMELNEQGVARWERTTTPTNRYIIEVRNTERYADCMTAALRALLADL
jgi:hypothetical protein